jgi:hypothetical protein
VTQGGPGYGFYGRPGAERLPPPLWNLNWKRWGSTAELLDQLVRKGHLMVSTAVCAHRPVPAAAGWPTGPPPELPPEGAVWVLLLAGCCAKEEGQVVEAQRLLDAAE